MSSLENKSISDLSESFLHFLDDDSFNKNRQTFCEEKIDTYHDSSYIWCKVCNKIFCTRCSLNHLINNQIDHTPSDKVFLRKEHFDVEFSRDCEKINEIKRNIEEFFSKSNKDNSQNEYKYLIDALSRFVEFTHDLTNFLDSFQKKIKIALENIQNKSKSIAGNNLREDNVRQHFKDICSKFKMIEKTYFTSQPFLPTQLKPYYDNLSSGYEECQKLNDLLEKNKNRNNFAIEIGDDCNKIKSILNNATSSVKSCKITFEKLINDIKI